MVLGGPKLIDNYKEAEYYVGNGSAKSKYINRKHLINIMLKKIPKTNFLVTISTYFLGLTTS